MPQQSNTIGNSLVVCIDTTQLGPAVNCMFVASRPEHQDFENHTGWFPKLTLMSVNLIKYHPSQQTPSIKHEFIGGSLQPCLKCRCPAHTMADTTTVWIHEIALRPFLIAE